MIGPQLLATLRNEISKIDEDLRSGRLALDRAMDALQKIHAREAKVCPICEAVYTPRRVNQGACCPRHAKALNNNKQRARRTTK